MARRKSYKLDDYETCKYCGHTGLLHGRSKGCIGVTFISGPFAGRCGCKIKRDLSIPTGVGF